MLRPPDKSSPVLSHYSRLFGGPFTGHDETHLRELSMRMKDIRGKVKEEMDDAKSTIDVARAGDILKSERCRIELKG